MVNVIWGATPSIKNIYKQIKNESELVYFVDNDKNKWGKKLFDEDIISPSELTKKKFDKIYILSTSAMDAIKQQIINMGIDDNKIDVSYVEIKVKARINFLKNFSEVIHKYKMGGCVAEAGVFQGEYAKEINACFPDKSLYLFDTFEGFDIRDVIVEHVKRYSDVEEGHLGITSEELVIGKMKYPEKCIIKKGYFPETASDVEEVFCFVSLDLDLYNPTIAGLKFFWEKMVPGGIIIVHDYFTEGYLGIADAVDEFAKEYNVIPFPIGDTISIALKK